MVKELTDKLHLIKKRMLNMHQRVKHLKVINSVYFALMCLQIINYRLHFGSIETFRQLAEAS